MPGRPISFRAVRERFFDDLREAASPWRVGATSRAPNVEAVENAFLRVVIGWEVFLSEWLTTGVVRDPLVFESQLQAEVDNWVLNKYAMTAAQLAVSGFPPSLRATVRLANPPGDEIRHLIDPSGDNVKLGSNVKRDWPKTANRFLSQGYATRVVAAVPAAGRANVGIVEAAVGIRNALAHRSRRSVTEMKSRLSALPSAALRVASLASVGGYLKHRPAGVPAYVRIPDRTPAALAAGTLVATQRYLRCRFMIFCEEFVRIAWILSPVGDT
jgi:hypothetical protein